MKTPSISLLTGAAQRVAAEARAAVELTRAGVVAPVRPDRLARIGDALLQWGPTPAGGYAAAAARVPDRVAVVDDAGSTTYGELDEATTRIAGALRARGIGPGTRVALLCRNHRWLVQAMVAVSKTGADALLLNTGLSAGQVRDVLAREEAVAVIADGEFAELLAEVPAAVQRITAWPHDGTLGSTLDELAATAAPGRLPRPPRPGRTVVLTSGTTGTPKGAVRSDVHSLSPAAALLSRIPLRLGRTTLVAAPLFHTWGFANLQIAMALTSTVVLQRRFDAAAVLLALQENRVDALVAVPVMLQRLLDADVDAHDLAALRIVAVSGSALPGGLAHRFMDAFGDVLYNLYGSTEVSWASIATPQELRTAPGTAGRPPRGTTLVLLGEDASEGRSGRIFVGNELLFDGYTGGVAGKERYRGLLATGDVGHLDDDGLLFVDGRDDDMVVSGGENVFPREVEDALAAEADIDDVVVVGVPDEAMGQRLAAYVVLRPGATLDADAVRALARARVARFAVPRDVVFLEALPRNATGKVVTRDLPAPA